jgi:hypothetical protein
MASTVTASTLTVSLTESITLNGQEMGATNTFTVASVNEIYKRIVNCPASVDTTVLKLGPTGATSDAELHVDDIRYLRVTNLDDTNSVNLNLQIDTTEHAGDASTADHNGVILLEPGKSFVMGTVADGIAVADDAATAITTLNDLESILIDPSANEVSIEVFAALV